VRRGVEVDERQAGAELFQQRVLEVGGADMLGQRLLDHRQKVPVGQRAARHRDDAAAGGHLAVREAIVQRRQQLAQREVAGSAEDDEIERRHRYDLGGQGHPADGSSDDEAWKQLPCPSTRPKLFPVWALAA